MQYLFPITVGLFLGFGVVLAVISFLLYQTMKQQGRLLLRLDSIDDRLRHLSQSRNPAPLAGLPTGEPFPTFKLPDLSGKKVALEEFVGKRVLLVNWKPHLRLLRSHRCRAREAAAQLRRQQRAVAACRPGRRRAEPQTRSRTWAGGFRHSAGRCPTHSAI